MLRELDLNKSLKKEEYKIQFAKLSEELSRLQRQLREEKIPVMVVFEGFGASGKGTMIGRLLKPLDPRGVKVYTIGKETEEEKYRPFLWRFWTKIPARGGISIFDRSWYRRLSADRFDREVSDMQAVRAYDEIMAFERQMTEDGAVLIKFFLSISREEQEKRFARLKSKKSTAWKVTEKDLLRQEHFEEYMDMNEEMLLKTNFENAPWTIVEAEDKKFATVKILSAVVKYLSDRLKQEESFRMQNQEFPVPDFPAGNILGQVDLSKSIPDIKYKQKLDKLQEKLSILHPEVYRRRLPVILVFEGWDAGGKGGAVKRLTAALDPRGYEVNPFSAPDETEKNHHYLWRFWRTIPKAGHIGIYDRSWYGRVLVERVEGLCTSREWNRAYQEINEMEQHLYHEGAVVLKFWMHIDQEEQLNRFRAREKNPDKTWKITEEDWRNREKWDSYERAAEDMLAKTSTEYAPWIVVEGNCKKSARIKVLETVVKYIEKGLEEI